MRNSRRELFKIYFFEPIGWMLSATAILVYLLMRLNILQVGNLFDFQTFAILITPAFSYSLGRLAKRLSPTIQRYIVLVSFHVMAISLLCLSLTYLRSFTELNVTHGSFFMLFHNYGIQLLMLLYVSSFLAISLSSQLEEKDLKEDINKSEKHSSISGFIFYTVSLVIIFFLGLILRVRQLYRLAFWTDESTSVIVAKQILEGKQQTLLTGEIYGRATMYHDYLAWFMKSFSFLGLNTSTRLANTPFYLLAFIGIFLLGRYVINRRAGLIAVILYTFSWISISIFRDARFYEMFVSIFVWLCFAIIYTYDVLSKSGVFTEKLSTVLEVSKRYYVQIFFGSVSVCVIAWICYNTQPFIVLILYPIWLFCLLVILFKNNSSSFKPLLIITLIIIGGTIYTYLDKFQLIYLIQAPQPDWKILLGNSPFNEFFQYLLVNRYGYFPAVLVLCLPLLPYVWNKKNILIVSFAAGWYMIIALQGYGSETVRYYYPAMIFAFIMVAAVFETYVSKLKNIPIAKYIMFLLMIIIISVGIEGGWVESNSTIQRNSPNRTKNGADDPRIDFLTSTGAFGKVQMLTDASFSLNYYLTFDEIPDYIVLNTDYVSLDPGSIDPYTGAKEIDYRNLNTVSKPAYFTFSYSSVNMGQNFLSELENTYGGVRVYKDNSRLIYYFPVATTSNATTR